MKLLYSPCQCFHFDMLRNKKTSGTARRGREITAVNVTGHMAGVTQHQEGCSHLPRSWVRQVKVVTAGVPALCVSCPI